MLAISLSLGSALVLPSRVATPVAMRGSVRMAESVPHDELTLAKYMSLPHPGKIMAEYLWIDARGEVRSKCRTVDAKKATLDQLPSWNYDGSSTGQAPGEDSEVIVKPRAIFKDPFRPGDNILVLTDTYTPAGEPLPTNTRVAAVAAFAGREDEVPWFGIEQEYTLFNLDKVTPLGWPKGGYPGPQGPYYCGAGADRSFGRFVSEAHYKACLYAGIQISGTNAEVRP
jgi:glutamine synthetase